MHTSELFLNIYSIFTQFSYFPGPPSKPEEPIECENISNDKIKVKWNRPKDNGGAPIANYVIEKFDPDRGTWVRAGSANELADEFIVPNLNEGVEYKFRVSAENIYGQSEPLESKPIVCKNPFGELEQWFIFRTGKQKKILEKKQKALFWN